MSGRLPPEALFSYDMVVYDFIEAGQIPPSFYYTGKLLAMPARRALWDEFAARFIKVVDPCSQEARDLMRQFKARVEAIAA